MQVQLRNLPGQSPFVKCRSSVVTQKGAPRSRGMPPKAIFGLGKPSREKISQKKEELKQYISGLNRGVTASEQDKEVVEKFARELERLNPTKKPLASPLVNGQWELIYTTSSSILGTSKPPFLRPQGPIYQLIESAKGSLSVSFLDEEMRISRGDKGNLFILLMDDQNKRP